MFTALIKDMPHCAFNNCAVSSISIRVFIPTAAFPEIPKERGCVFHMKTHSQKKRGVCVWALARCTYKSFHGNVLFTEPGLIR